MANGQVFSLRDTYGAGIRDRQVEDLRTQQTKAVTSQNQAADIFRSTAQEAVNPESGEYSPVTHARALEQKGYPDAAQTIRQKALESTEKGYEFLQHSLPFINEQTWPRVKQQAEQGGLVPPGTLPDQYDPKFLAQLEQRLVGQLTELYGDIEKVATGPGGAEIYGQREQHSGKLANVTTIKPPSQGQGGEPLVKVQTPEGVRYVPRSQAAGMQAPATGGEAGGLKASDTNAIYRQASGLFGGMFDPVTGRIAGLNREQAEQVQAIASRASQIFSETGIDHATAVQQAFEEVRGGGAPGSQNAPGPAATGQPVQISNAQDYAQLPSGAQYIDPNGQPRTKR